MEAENENEFVYDMDIFYKQYKKIKNPELSLNTLIISGHGNPKGIYLNKDEKEESVIGINDKKNGLFKKIAKIVGNDGFRQLLINSCSTGKKSPGFEPIAYALANLNIAKSTYAPPSNFRGTFHIENKFTTIIHLGEYKGGEFHSLKPTG